jgi:hypothetical protein
VGVDRATQRIEGTDMTDPNPDVPEHGGFRPRKSLWNVVLVLFGVQSIGLCWWGLFKLVELAQGFLAPGKHFGRNLSNLGEIFMVIPLFLPSAAIGLLVANLRVWVFPAAREALEEEARTRSAPDFRTATRQLAIAAAVLLAVALPVSLLGAVDFFR